MVRTSHCFYRNSHCKVTCHLFHWPENDGNRNSSRRTEMKHTFILLVTSALCVGLLSSCSPRSISGQVVLTRSGVNYPLGAVQVEVISARDAEDFMTQVQAQIDAKRRALKTDYDNAKTARDTTAREESQTPTTSVKAKLARAQAQLDKAATALKAFPKTNDYFESFFPNPIETCETGAEGDFTIERPGQPAKVFVKAQRQMSDSAETYFWLVDLPATGNSLVLNNDNMFKVPQQ